MWLRDAQEFVQSRRDRESTHESHVQTYAVPVIDSFTYNTCTWFTRLQHIHLVHSIATPKDNRRVMIANTFDSFLLLSLSSQSQLSWAPKKLSGLLRKCVTQVDSGMVLSVKSCLLCSTRLSIIVRVYVYTYSTVRVCLHLLC
jgi:hypothetical protein